MAGKLKLLVGFGTGYVLGTRAGRERYDQMAGKAQELWRDPRVQEKAEQAQQIVKEKVGDKANGTGSGSSSRGAAAASGTRATAASRTSTGTSS